MKNPNVLVVLILCLISSFDSNAQYCSGATASVPITPDIATQNTGYYYSGFISFPFYATAGCNYNFNTCGQGSTDRYLRLYNAASGGSVISTADDNCGSMQPTLNWTCSTSGDYSILLSDYYCSALSTATYLTYSSSCSATPPADPTSISVSAYAICIGASTTLTANDPSGTVYWFTGACNNTGQIGTGNSATVSPSTTTTYYARNFNGGLWSTGCASTTITVNQPSQTTFTTLPQTICSGISTTIGGNITATGAWTITLSNGQTVTGSGSGTWSKQVSPAVTTTFSITSLADLNGSGCPPELLGSVVISVSASPSAPTPVSATPTNICPVGGSSNLNATSSGNSISWFTVPSAGSTIGTSLSAANYSVTPNATTIYYAEAQSLATSGSQTLSYTGGAQTFTVPTGVTTIHIESWGAEGGSASNNVGGGWDPLSHMGGDGGYATGDLAVLPGQVVQVNVGGAGIAGSAGGAGGFNGGGMAMIDGTTASGGGASDIRIAPNGLGNRVLVAGGGGGAEWAGGGNQAGQGGGLIGGPNGNGDSPAASGFPGNQSASGAAGGDPCGGFYGVPNPGSFGVGGNSINGHSGAGGGGWYGGGGSGCDGHGGGGSSYLAGVTAGSTTPGLRQGNGQVIISWAGGNGCVSNARTPITVTICFSALPVELTALQANCKENNTIEVSWTTASEHNSANFVVENSRDGISWNVIGVAAAAGNSTDKLDYFLTDNAAFNGLNYYRLTQNDIDGVSKVYPIINESCLNTTNYAIEVYPNPSDGNFSVEFENSLSMVEGKILLTDSRGVVVVESNVHVQNGKNIFNIERAHIAAGIYYLQIVDGVNESETIKVCIK
jgi:hypothetical protein